MPYMSLNFFRLISSLDLSAEKGQRIAICRIDNSKNCQNNQLKRITNNMQFSMLSWYRAQYCNSTNIKSNLH